MIQLDDVDVARRLPWKALTAAIEKMVLGGGVAPRRQTYHLTGQGGEDGHFLMMPAWADDSVIGVKLVTAWPDNIARGLPNHGASYILLDARSGEVRAALAAEALTHRRTAAVSVLAATRLLPAEAERLLVVGTGPVAEQIVRAHADSGRFSSISLFGRAPDKVAALLTRLGDLSLPVDGADDLEIAVRRADMIVGATGATTPWLQGDWLGPNSHVDLVGGYTPTMRESDDRSFARASAIWVDTVAAVEEAGDIVQPLAANIIGRDAIKGDMRALLESQGLREGGITVFKSVGTATADLAAAQLVLAG